MGSEPAAGREKAGDLWTVGNDIGIGWASRSASPLISSIILRLITKEITSMGKRLNARRLFQSGA